MIVCDENLSQRWINLFEAMGYKTLCIRDHFSGIPDTEVIQIAIQNDAILVTEDKDFGEIVFSKGVKNVAVVLLRYDQPDFQQIERFLLEILKEYFKSKEPFFYTITKQQVRRRKI